MNMPNFLLRVVSVNRMSLHTAVNLLPAFFLFLILMFSPENATAFDRNLPPCFLGGEHLFNRLKPLSNEQLLRDIKIFKYTEAGIDKLLPELQRCIPNHLKRLKAIAAMYTGAPYCADPLTDEKTDWLPYARTNCTMFVLYVTAFANSRSCKEALLHMRHLHYRGGTVGFKTRYHFSTDRITDPANIYFSLITRECIKDPAVLKEVTLLLNRKRDGGYFFSGRLDSWSRKVTVSYIPRAGFNPELLIHLPEAVGIALVKQSNWENGIIVGHEGLLIDGDLFHSAPSSGVSIIRDFLTTGFPLSQWEGIILFRINEISPAGKHRTKQTKNIQKLCRYRCI